MAKGRNVRDWIYVDDHITGLLAVCDNGQPVIVTWVTEFNAAGVPCGPIYSIDQMFEDEQVKHLGIAQDVPNAENRHIRLVGQPVTLSRTPSKMAARPQEFGEQTEEVLAEFGFSAHEIEGLRQAKVV